MVRRKKDDGDAKPKAIKHQEERRQRGSSVGVLLNAGLAITIFFALIQFFDPTMHEHHEHEIEQHNVQSNPVMVGLAEFSHGRHGIRKGREHDVAGEYIRRGRERILALLEEAGVAKDLTEIEIAKLPKWDQIVELYGEQVVIVGKDECAKFRQQVPIDKAMLAVAGMFNTGTNLLDTQIRKNIKTRTPNLWQVSWGKHRPAIVRWNHTAPQMEEFDKSHQLPVVVIRDPFFWLQSMCSHPYAATWHHGEHHCPNLVPTSIDYKEYRGMLDEGFPVLVKFDKHSHSFYDSLVHLWSDWYRQYLEADYPVLMVRFEDLIFQPVAVLREIADCVHGELSTPIHYQVNTSKAHGSGTNYVKALIKTADAPMRPQNMTEEDLAYAKKHLDAQLMEMFHYKVPSPL